MSSAVSTAARPVEPELADLSMVVADPWTPASGKPWFDRFRAACWEVASKHPDRLINPNHVRRLLIDDPAYNPRRYSAAWSAARSRGAIGFLDATDTRVPIDPDGSKHNGAKDVRLRRWRDGVPAAP